jgi:hypothetical protein
VHRGSERLVLKLGAEATQEPLPAGVDFWIKESQSMTATTYPKSQISEGLRFMQNHTRLSGISEDVWRAIIAGLKATGWSARIGGGLDFSWASLTRDGIRIDMEYDIWLGG